MTDRDDLDMQIAEFVLGTLPAGERDDLQSRRETDPALNARILAWEQRLSVMTDEVDPVEPDPDLFEKIERAIEKDTAGAGGPEANREPNKEPNNLVTLRRQVNRWRWSTAVASAAAMVLVAVLAFQPEPATSPESFVAVFQHNDQQPAFLLTVNLENRQVNIRPVTAEARPDKSYQLWIKADELGPKPRSVGVLGDQFELDRAALSQYDPALLREATFGISVEPPGGSPTGQPTGPAIHGYLYPAGDEPNAKHPE